MNMNWIQIRARCKNTKQALIHDMLHLNSVTHTNTFLIMKDDPLTARQDVPLPRRVFATTNKMYDRYEDAILNRKGKDEGKFKLVHPACAGRVQSGVY